MSSDKFEIFVRLAYEYPAETRRNDHAATAELLNVPGAIRVSALRDKLYVPELAVVKDAVACTDFFAG